MSTSACRSARPTLPAMPTPISCDPYAPVNPESSIASSAAATPKPPARERCRCAGGSKSLTIPAICTGKVSASKVVILVTPERPARRDCQVCSAELPTGVTAPRPVTATRLSTPDHTLQPLRVLERGQRLDVDQRAHDV